MTRAARRPVPRPVHDLPAEALDHHHVFGWAFLPYASEEKDTSAGGGFVVLYRQKHPGDAEQEKAERASPRFVWFQTWIFTRTEGPWPHLEGEVTRDGDLHWQASPKRKAMASCKDEIVFVSEILLLAVALGLHHLGDPQCLPPDTRRHTWHPAEQKEEI